VTSTVDLLRLLVVPVFAWAAYRDVRTRRVPNRVWGPLFVAGAVSLALAVRDAYAAVSGFALTVELVAIAVSVGVVAPVAYLFWLFGGFGGADAKALLVLSLLVPVYPAYDVFGLTLPLPEYHNPLGSFAFTILVNTVLVGALYPAALAVRNAARGRLSPLMFLGERVAAGDVDDRYGTVMGATDGVESGRLDLDALRMYLTWRDATLAELRAEPATYRDPASLPDERQDPGGGEIPPEDRAVDANDGEGSAPDGSLEADGDGTDRRDGGDGGEEAEADAPEYDDPWGAAAFLEEIEGDAYGTSPDALRDGLDALAANEAVWVSPGIPFIVPMFFGLVLSLTVGDLTAVAIELL